MGTMRNILQSNSKNIPMGKRSREETDNDSKPNTQDNTATLHCPFCSTLIYGYHGFQTHFLTFHEYQCLTCNKIFPSRYILDLHIDEYHNPILKAQSERKGGEDKSILRCLSENCAITFTSLDLRIDHLINHHNYPETYPFNITSQGISSPQLTTF